MGGHGLSAELRPLHRHDCRYVYAWYWRGVVQYGLDWASLLPAIAYFAINLVESQFVTPTILGRHMRLNPLILILWLLVWGWLWGPVGVLIAVPLLVCIKLMAAQLNVLGSWVRLIETGG